MFCNVHYYTCVSGYYCPEGAGISTQVICPIGRHCPEGSAVPMACVDGTYTDYDGALLCMVCPEGSLVLCNAFFLEIGPPLTPS